MAALAEQFASLLGADNADLELYVGESKELIRAHKLVLMVRSPFFKAMLDSGMRESS